MNKSKIINIVIIIVALALIAFLVFKDKKTDNGAENETPNTETPDNTNGTGANAGGAIPVPAESSWTETKGAEDKITFDAPAEYYISYPVIGGCSDVVSISTQTASDPTIAVAMIYKEGCVTDTDVTMNYAMREVKNGYVFQTNSNHPTVRAVFDRIVASAQIKD